MSVTVVVLLLLGVLVGRLGELQLVDSGSAGTAEGPDGVAAMDTRTIPLPALRGRILDRNGIPLVANTTTMSVTMDRRVFVADPVRAREGLTELAELLGRDAAEVIGRAHLCGEDGAPAPPLCWNGSPQAPIPVATDVDPAIALSLLERPDRYPGLAAAMDPHRTYPAPEGVNLAQVLGYLGRVTPAELEAAAASTDPLLPDDLMGRSGLEATYDAALRGRPGEQIVTVDPRGIVTGDMSRIEPTPGRDLRTSLDVRLQYVAESALGAAIDGARSRGEVADSGAIVVMDATTGEVLADVSRPTYDPDVWTGGISAGDYAQLTDPTANHPLLDRVSGVPLAPASTIKALSVPAAAAAGWSVTERHACPGSYFIGDREFTNFESTAHAPLDFLDALRVSCDTVFYAVAHQSWLAQGGLAQTSDAGDPFIAVDRAFGLGQPTGIDLPGEAAGSVPSREAKRAAWERQREDLCARAVSGYPEVAATDPDRAAYLTQLAVENCATGFQYRAGDAANLAIGQGELAATPLQMAVAYAALANRGTVLTPRVGLGLLDPVTGAEEAIPPGPTRSSGLDPALADYVGTGLRSVVTSGTAVGAFAGMPDDWPVAGKTGTAEVFGKGDTSWFVSWAPTTAPRYVVAVAITQGGTGADTAAPAARAVHDALRDRELAGAAGR